MAITEQEAEKLEIGFLEAWDDPKQAAQKSKEAWDYLVSLMERENNFSNKLGLEGIDWQIGNWANDVEIELMNAGRYKDVIEVNEDILKIDWGGSNDNFHENALRDIADAHAYMGDADKCFELYEEYLKKDPLWGWGWIGYYRQLNERGADGRFEQVLDDLYRKVQSGEDFRDKEDLYRELGDEYNTLGNKERADYFYALEDEEKKKYGNKFRNLMPSLFENEPVVKPKKIYPNDPCPCGSGKKYKKCCGRK